MAITIQKPIYNHYSVDIETEKQAQVFIEFCIQNNITKGDGIDCVCANDSFRIKNNNVFQAGEFGFYRKDIEPSLIPEICFTFDEWLSYIGNIPITKIEFTEFEW